jgi:hypothetical protein
VPSSDDFAMPLAFGLPVVVSGGQAVAQAPLQMLLEPWSASQRYSARPLASTRKVPSELVLVPTIEAGRGEPAGFAALVAVVAVLEVLDEPELPQAASTSALASASAARRKGRVMGSPGVGVRVPSPTTTPRAPPVLPLRARLQPNAREAFSCA